MAASHRSIKAYIEEVSLRGPQVLKALREETRRHRMSMMLLDATEGQLLSLLVQAIGARRAIEVGTFTGYSSLCVALALPDDGRLVALDIDPEATAIARRYWNEAGVAHKIELKIGPALESLDAMVLGGQDETYDFAFIDADKSGYDAYYERALKLVRPGGLIVFDNMLYGGEVLEEHPAERNAVAIKALNRKIGRDERVDQVLLPVSDGVLICRKR